MEGRVPPNHQCCHNCPCTASDRNTIVREMGWFSLNNEWEKSQFAWLSTVFWASALDDCYCNILPDQAQISTGAHLPVYCAAEQGQGQIRKYLRHFKAFKEFHECQLHWQKASSPVIQRSCPRILLYSIYCLVRSLGWLNQAVVS